MAMLPINRVVLYKHGVGHFERVGFVEGDAALSLTFKQSEVSDVLKSLTVLDLDGGHIASVSYDSTKPLEQLLEEVALTIPDEGSLVGLLPQIKGARVAVEAADGSGGEGMILGIDTIVKSTKDGVVKTVLLSLLTDQGDVRSFDLHGLVKLEVLDTSLRRDLDYYLKTQLSSKKKDARTFTFFAQGQGRRGVRASYTLAAPVWKATYRIILGEEGKPPLVQGWAVVDNTQDEDWEGVRLSLVAGLPVSFIHDLYTPRYIRRPVVEVKETTGVLPPTVEEGQRLMSEDSYFGDFIEETAAAPMVRSASLGAQQKSASLGLRGANRSAVSSAPAQVRERKLGDLFEYEIEHPVTIKRNQSALVPIVLRPFEGRPVLLHNRDTRPGNPMRCVEFKNTTGLTLEGGPVTVLEGGSYVGEAMLDTLKPDEERLVPYAVELGVHVLDNVESHQQKVHRVVIKHGVLTTFSTQEMQTTYHFNNKSDLPQTLYLDHPRGGAEWKLHDTQEPRETTENYWRFRFELPAKKTTPFRVLQRLTIHQGQGFHDFNTQQLAFWIEQRYVDARTQKVLKEVIEVQKQAAELEQRLHRLNEEKSNIHTEQGRIRENLQALGDRPSEKDLRERFVKTLNGQEDRLAQITNEFQKVTGERDRCREKVAFLLNGLEYEAVIGH
jgi:hypothetical protein